MIHGGLRYLENGCFSLVAEATRERNLLLRNAPHLVQPLKTVVPLSSFFGGLDEQRAQVLRPQRRRSARAACWPWRRACACTTCWAAASA